MTPALRGAQDNLNILRVTLRNSDVKLDEEIDVDILNELPVRIQGYRSVSAIRGYKKTGVLENGEEVVHHRYIFVYSVGCRVIDPEIPEDGEVKPYLEVSCEFDAHYDSLRELKEDEVDAFSENNVGVNVWPYWREFVHSMFARVGMEKVINVPFYRFDPSSK
jgi:hypothetical protein